MPDPNAQWLEELRCAIPGVGPWEVVRDGISDVARARSKAVDHLAIAFVVHRNKPEDDPDPPADDWAPRSIGGIEARCFYVHSESPRDSGLGWRIFLLDGDTFAGAWRELTTVSAPLRALLPVFGVT